MLDDFIGLYLVMGIFFALSIAIHYITVHPYFHTLPKDVDPNDLGGSRRLLRRKIVAPGVHKIGPDRFDDAHREIQVLKANQDRMNDCLEEMLGIFREFKAFRADESDETEMSQEMGLLEDNPQDTRDSSTAATPPESPLPEDMDESLESVSMSQSSQAIDQDRRLGAVVRRMLPLRLRAPSLAPDVHNSQVDAHADEREGNRAKLSADVQDAEMKSAMPWLEPAASEPSTTFSPFPTNLLRRLGASSNRASRTAAPDTSNAN
jgi:hypothetical protein